MKVLAVDAHGVHGVQHTAELSAERDHAAIVAQQWKIKAEELSA